MFLLPQSINRGNFRSAGISRFIAKPLRLYQFPSLASASFGRLLLRRSTILGYYPLDLGCFTKNLWDFPMLAWLLHRRCQARCYLKPRGVGKHSSITRFPYCLHPVARDRHIPKIPPSRGYGADSGHTPLTSLDSHNSIRQSHTIGRLTKPYPRGLLRTLSLSTMNQRQVQTQRWGYVESIYQM